MNKAILAALILFGGFCLVAGVALVWGIGQYNIAVSLRTQYDSKVKANEAGFDNLWKKIQQTAQVTDAQKAALKEIFVSYAEARTGAGGGGELMKWVQESVPNVDVSVYRNLQNIITGSRDEWTRNQVELVDIANSYNLMLARFPSNILLGALGFQKIDAKVITSSRTEQAFATGKDDDVDLKLSK
jgi:rubrerythrin